MGYYKDLRRALERGDLGNPESESYKLVMGAKKPLLDIIFYQKEEDDCRTNTMETHYYINEKYLNHIGFWGTPELVEKVYHQIKKYKSRIFDDKEYCNKFYSEGYLSRTTADFRASLYKKCGILWFIDDDFCYSAYTWHFSDIWGTPWNWWKFKFIFYRKYIVEYAKTTGEGFYETYLHKPRALVKELDNYKVDAYELRDLSKEEIEEIKNIIREAAKYLVDYHEDVFACDKGTPLVLDF